MWSNIFSRSLARVPWVMMAISWLKAAPAARLMTYRVIRMVTSRKMVPDAAAQSPVL